MNYRKFYTQKFWQHLVTTPIIWLPLFALLILDLMISIYQAICFPIYGITKVKRDDYILVRDRNKLQYLNATEKLGCMYCGYANGFLLYAKEIASRTEKYWCGIMHEDKPGFKPDNDQLTQDFAPYGDEEEFKEKYGEIL